MTPRMSKHKRTRQPMQPIEWDGLGVLRFKANPIVRYLLDHGGLDMNALTRATIIASVHDWDQFYQLIGYSVSGAPLRSELTRFRADDRAARYLEDWPTDPDKKEADRG